MLVQLGVNEDLAKCHSLARRIPGSIVLWNGSNYQVGFETKTQAKLCAVALATGGFFYGGNAVAAWKSGDLGMSILCGYLCFLPAAYAASSLAFRANAHDCAAFLNGLLAVANGWINDEAFRVITRPRPLVKLLSRMLIMAQVVYPWAFVLIALAWPCSSLNMFSSVSGWWWCSSGGGINSAGIGTGPQHVSWLARVAIGAGTALPHLAFWKALISQGILGAMHTLLGPLCLKTLLQHVSNRLLMSSDFPSHLKGYRVCQILNTTLNNYGSSLAFSIIAALLAGEISVTYLVVKILGGSSKLPLLIKIVMTAACPLIYLFHVMAVREAAHVNIRSVSLLTNVVRTSNNNNNNMRSRLTRRQIRSAWPLKIKLGDSNFIEAITTLVLLDFTLRRLVDLLLIGG